MDELKKHTAIISDPVGMWSKLAWDADVFSDIQKSYPDERQPLAYAAINVCIAASSLQNWAEAFRKRKSRKSKEPWVDDTFSQGILDTIPEQPACIAISRSTLYLLIASGDIEIIKLGASTLVLTESLKRFINDKRRCAS